jgi:hypothetical protein
MKFGIEVILNFGGLLSYQNQPEAWSETAFKTIILLAFFLGCRRMYSKKRKNKRQLVYMQGMRKEEKFWFSLH